MTTMQKRIQIAKSALWRVERANIHTFHVWEPGAEHPLRVGLNLERVVPDYFGSLNAIREAILTRTPEERFEIACRVKESRVKKDIWSSNEQERWADTCFASAAEYSQAYLEVVCVRKRKKTETTHQHQQP